MKICFDLNSQDVGKCRFIDENQRRKLKFVIIDFSPEAFRFIKFSLQSNKQIHKYTYSSVNIQKGLKRLHDSSLQLSNFYSPMFSIKDIVKAKLTQSIEFHMNEKKKIAKAFKINIDISIVLTTTVLWFHLA